MPYFAIVTWGVGGTVKVNILHKLLSTAMLSASGSALQSLCKKSEEAGTRVLCLWSTDDGG